MELTPSQARIQRQRIAIQSLVAEKMKDGLKKRKAVILAAQILGITPRWIYKTLKQNEDERL